MEIPLSPEQGNDPLWSEIDLRTVFYLRKEEDVLNELTFEEVKSIIRQPALTPPENVGILMYHQNQIVPAHFPQLQDAAAIPTIPWLFLNWVLKKEGGVEDEEREILFRLGQLVDPKPLISKQRTRIKLRFSSVEWTAFNNTNAVMEMEILPMLKQMSFYLNWGEERGAKSLRLTTVRVHPQRRRWICPMTGEEVDPWAEDQTGVIKALKRKPHIPYNMSVLFWNSRGLARPSFKPNLMHLISHNRPDMLILAETKTSRNHTANIVGSLPFDSWFLADPVGYAGGLLMMWNSARVNVHIISHNTQGIHALVEVTSKTPFFISAIYASPKFSRRKLLWNDLCVVVINFNLPWLVIGDFNEVMSQNEKWGGRPINNHRANLFKQTINNCNLLDLGFNGPKFTWTNKRKNNPIYERLDRGFGNGDWFDAFPNSCIWHLTKITSDHAPVLCLLDKPSPSLGGKPFRFEPMWLQDPTCEGIIQEAWVSEIKI